MGTSFGSRRANAGSATALLGVFAWLAVFIASPAHGYAQGCDASSTDRTVLFLKTPIGDRLVVSLVRKGDELTGSAYVHKKDGTIPGRGSVRGRFARNWVEHTGRKHFELWVYFFPPAEPGTEWLAKGWLERGGGEGMLWLHTYGEQSRVDISTRTDCPKWPQEYFLDPSGSPGGLPAPPYSCVPGFVWREAHPWDKVCVLPLTRDQVRRQNELAPSRTKPDGTGCLQPYFMRLAIPGDTTCVGLDDNLQIERDNELREHRLINLKDGRTDLPDIRTCRGFGQRAGQQHDRLKQLGCKRILSSSPEAAVIDRCMNNMLSLGVQEAVRLEQQELDALTSDVLRCELANKPYPKFEERGPMAPTPPSKTSPAAIAEPNAETAASMPGMEHNIDRPGSDYHRFELDGRVPDACQSACANDSARCLAWTYVRPGVQGPKAVCYLKNAAPSVIRNSCCVSGLQPKTPDRFKHRPSNVAPSSHATQASRTSPAAMAEVGGFAPAAPALEENIDRPGADFARHAMDGPHQCQAACVDDKRCDAWTFVRAGIQAPTGVCYLKRPIPAAVPNTCCISGTVKR